MSIILETIALAVLIEVFTIGTANNIVNWIALRFDVEPLPIKSLNYQLKVWEREMM